MSSQVLELNGSELRCYNETGMVAGSAGYAIIEKREVLTGDSARAVSRANPRLTHNRYWERLNQEPLSNGARHARHNADLAYAQLSALLGAAGTPASLVVAANGAYTQEQLGLLLGLAQAAGTSVSGLVDPAVAAGAACLAPGRYLHIETEAHRLVLTSLEVDEEVTRSKVDSLEEVGLVRIHDTVAKSLGDAFIRQSRFDPFHEADTEQALYDALPAWLSAVARGVDSHDTTLSLTFNGRAYEVRVPVDQVTEPVRQCLEPLRDFLEADSAIVLGDRIAALPGLRSILGECYALPGTALAEGVHSNLNEIALEAEGLRYVTRLPATAQPTIRVEQASTQAQSGTVTHLVGEQHGYALASRALYLAADGTASRRADEAHIARVYFHDGSVHVSAETEAPVLLNGRRLDASAAVRPGDRLTLGDNGPQLRAVEVKSVDGA